MMILSVLIMPCCCERLCSQQESLFESDQRQYYPFIDKDKVNVPAVPKQFRNQKRKARRYILRSTQHATRKKRKEEDAAVRREDPD